MTIRTLGVAATCALSISLTGCGELLALHALFTAKDQLHDPAIEVRWENDASWLIVERAESGYELTLQLKENPKEETKFETHLVDLGGARFADILPKDGIGHMIAQVRVVGSQLRIAFLDSEWLRNEIPHEEADIAGGRKQAILTEPTPALREVAAKYAAEPRAYDEVMTFRRAK